MLKVSRCLFALAAGSLIAPAVGISPVYADGAASTRNIIFGAAAAAGTLLVINHNKKVHQRYAEDAQRQADLERQRDNLQAAYDSERRAYDNEVALVASYQHEVAVQHDEVVRDRAQISSLEHSLALAATRSHRTVAQRRSPQPVHVAAAPVQHAAPAQNAPAPEVVSYGWGTL